MEVFGRKHKTDTGTHHGYHRFYVSALIESPQGKQKQRKKRAQNLWLLQKKCSIVLDAIETETVPFLYIISALALQVQVQVQVQASASSKLEQEDNHKSSHHRVSPVNICRFGTIHHRDNVARNAHNLSV